MQTLLEKCWHCLTVDEMLTVVNVSLDKGLDRFEIKHRQERFGSNLITKKKDKGPILRFLLQFHQPLVYILLASSFITAFLKEIVDAAVIFGVVLINSIVGFVQENKAVNAVESLNKQLSDEATVLRAGKKTKIPTDQLVPGDVVFIQAGDKVPADLRLTQVRDLRVDESALTGESIPVEKSTHILELDTPLSDRTNVIFSSSLVVSGTGTGIVVAIGDQTEIGRISEMIASAELIDTPLTKRIKQFSNVLLVGILSLAGITFLVGLFRGQTLFDTFMAVVALAVAAIPEGLPAAVTIILAIGVARMAKKRAIIRRLPAVETLGSTTIICSDKTGTLTKNQMTVVRLFSGMSTYELTGVGYDVEGELRSNGTPISPDDNLALRECLIAGLLCNDSHLTKRDGEWKLTGDPTEAALTTAALKVGLPEKEIRSSYPRIDSVPFESKTQYMATLHSHNNHGSWIAYVKGSPESILPRCSNIADSLGSRSSFDETRIHEELQDAASQGLRVLAFAKKEFISAPERLEDEHLQSELTFLGMLSMIDPPRMEAAAAIEKCKTAGIDVKMITGDHATTAQVIASKLGILVNSGESNTKIVSGTELSQLSDDDLIQVAQDTAVFARVSPEHKLRIVEALQARQEVIAMTGDGVNDAPALRQADIGIAMAISGTDVAREAADMVLTDDNFATIEAAVEEGRGVYDNLRKFIVWTLPTNGGQGLVIMVAILLGLSLPILPVQVLWLNMTSVICLGLMLAFEPKEPGIMERHPRRSDDSILNWELGLRILLSSVLLSAGAFAIFRWELAVGSTAAEARTAATTVFVIGQIFFLFNCRSLTKSVFSKDLPTNKWIWFGSFLMLSLQAMFSYLPFMNMLFQTERLRLEAWIYSFVIGLGVFLIIGLEKLLLGKYSDA